MLPLICVDHASHHAVRVGSVLFSVIRRFGRTASERLRIQATTNKHDDKPKKKQQVKSSRSRSAALSSRHEGGEKKVVCTQDV